MTNLIDKVGQVYFNRRFQGSYFMDDKGRPSILQAALGDGEVTYIALTGTPSRVIETTRTLPNEFFTGLETFSVPTLGWRSHSEGRYLAFFSRNNRSYHRGLSVGNLNVELSPMTRWLVSTKNVQDPRSDKVLCLLALKPNFTPFTEGVRQMREGEILSFAVSPTIAVVPDEDDKFSIYFRQAKAGTVMPDNSVVVDVPLLSEYVGDSK